MKIKKVVSYICLIMILASTFNPVSAGTIIEDETTDDVVEDVELTPYELPDFIKGDKDSDDKSEKIELNKVVKADEIGEIIAEESSDEAEVLPVKLTVDQAVEYGLKNSPSIGMLDNAIDLAVVNVSYSEEKSDDLEDAKEKLNKAENDLFDLRIALDKNQEELDTAYSYLSNGISPVNITYKDIGMTREGLILTVGDDIEKTFYDMFISQNYSENEAKDKAAYYSDLVSKKIKAQLDENQNTIDEYNIAMDEAQETLDYNKDLFELVLDDVADKLDSKINYSSVVQLDTDDAVDLMITMSNVNLDVTRYAKEIYRNQIAMLIQKNYYDALYAEKMVDLKKVVMERGEKQYNLTKLSYENGMKAKDDMLLSKMYYDGTKVEYRLAQSTYNKGICELKKNMNYDIDTEIKLVEPAVEESSVVSLEEALKSGKKNRLEMQRALGQWMIYKLNEDILNSSQIYKYEEDSLDEARLLREGSELELQKIKKTIECEIYQSYEDFQATKDMLDVTSNLVQDAEEALTIAELKYEQGLGAENSLLQKMNLESSTGTIVEVIAAQENLADMEAKVGQIRYKNIMAKVKYLNDAGILVY